MRHEKLASLAALAITALVTAVGADAGTPTAASWANAANAVCTEGNSQIRLLPKYTTATYVADIQATGRIATRENARIAAIPRPASERALIAAFVQNALSSNRLFVGQFIPAVERHDVTAAQALFKRIDALGIKYNAMARKLGARVCAQDPVPSG